MNLSTKRLKGIWKRLNASMIRGFDLRAALKQLGASDDVITYGEGVLDSLEEILAYQLPDELKNSSETARDKDCPRGIQEGGSDEVKRLLIANSNGIGNLEDREKCLNLVWGKLSRIKGNRVPDYRIASNANGFSSFETFNTTITQGNPDPWIYSYNFPWHLISWLQDVHAGKNPPSYRLVYGNNQEDVLDKKFSLKYLWMLASPEVVPILSLRSFLNLVTFFEDIHPGFKKEFGLDYINCWQQGFESYTQCWKQVSKEICAVLSVTAEAFSVVRHQLAMFLFCVSLMDNTTRDLGTMVEKGNKAVILYGPPGTGKTYAAKNFIFSALGIPSGQEEKFKKKDEGGFRYGTEKGEVTLVQFHPNYSYQDFVGGIFPGVDTTTKQIFYDTREGVFKKLCDRARKESNKKFYLLIDEINRADLSAVFGELMFGLEYRNFAMDIPVFGEFSIPDNVYLIGTMNNTDKSLVGFDLALRRRFAFLRLGPDMDVIAQTAFIPEKEGANDNNDETINIAQEFANRAKKLNDQLSTILRLPREKRIGHAYFLKAKEFCEQVSVQGNEKAFRLTEYALEQLWDYHLQPLLEEFLGLEAEEQEQVRAMNAMKQEFCGKL